MTLPPLPSTVGKKGKLINPLGDVQRYVVVDEVRLQETDYPVNINMLQLIRFEDDHEELREAQGDRWLGFEPGALGVMAGAAGFVMERKRRHELPSGLRLWIYVFRKNGNGGKRNG